MINLITQDVYYLLRIFSLIVYLLDSIIIYNIYKASKTATPLNV